MKKYLLLLVAAIGLLATACSEDEGHIADEPTVSFVITTPDLQTRYGEGETATVLHWEVYVGDTHLTELDGTKTINGQTTVDLRLVLDKTYNLLFWAEAPGQDVYTFADRKLTIDASKLKANQESYDAFYAYEDNFVATYNPNGHIIELRRPFAQLNVATSDMASSASAGVYITETAVELDAYTVLDLKDGEVSGKQTLKYVMEPRATGIFSYNQKDYDMLSMNYLLVNAKEVTNVKLSALNGNETLVRDYPLVHFQRNHRTFIIGDLFTIDAGFNVIIKPGFDDEEFIVE